MASNILSIRMDEKTQNRLNKLAEVTSKPKSALATEAIKIFLDLNEWQIDAIKEGIQDADEGKMVDHEKVLMWVNSWGTENELERPI